MNYLKELSDKIHANSVEKGFGDTPFSAMQDLRDKFNKQ